MNKRGFSGVFGVPAWVAWAVWLVLAGCAPEAGEDGGQGGPGSAGGGGTAGSAGGTGSAGTFGNQPTAGTGVGAAGSTGGTGSAGSLADECGGTTVEPKTIEIEVEVEVTKAEPVAIYIMLDNSGSMALLWPGAVQAITDFVNDPMSAGLDVALSIFPGVAAACDSAVYALPNVAMGRLPAHAPAITAGLPPFPAGSGTNIEPALRGATDYCKTFTPATPEDAGEKCVVLFITDGDPSTCSLDKNALAQIAGDAYTNDGVRTFTIALQGAQPAFLDDVAKRGGGDCDPNSATSTCDLTMGARFLTALESIRATVTTIETHTEVQKQALECEWGLPDPKPGETFDKQLVNVLFASAPGTAPDTLLFAATAGDCGDRANAWHYDDPNAPTRILACPKTCDAIKTVTDGRIDVVLGCPVVPVE
jgi:hypothetical protein